jgi:hypothetical protein
VVICIRTEIIIKQCSSLSYTEEKFHLPADDKKLKFGVCRKELVSLNLCCYGDLAEYITCDHIRAASSTYKYIQVVHTSSTYLGSILGASSDARGALPTHYVAALKLTSK